MKTSHRYCCALLLLSLSFSPLSTRAQSDAAWTGTWSGTYSYINDGCSNLPNPGTITLNLYVSNGVVTGNGIEYDKLCYDLNTCQVTGSGTLSGTLTGTVSNNSITVSGNWLDSCNGQIYPMQIGGTLSGSTITGHPDLTLQKQAATNLLVNGDFESGNFSGWTLSGDTNDTFIDDGSFFGPPFSGSYEADLGTISSMGYLSQSIPTAAGANYLLSFWFSNPDMDPNEFFVNWNGKTLFARTNFQASNWTNVQVTLPSSSTSGVLQFEFEDDSFVVLLDDVSVMAVTKTPPRITGISLSGTN